MPIDFVGDWCSPWRDDAAKNKALYTLPSWTEDGHCTDILSIDKYGFYFVSEKMYCETVNIRLGKNPAPTGIAYTATLTTRCQPDGPLIQGELKIFEFSRYKGNLTVTTK